MHWFSKNILLLCDTAGQSFFAQWVYNMGVFNYITFYFLFLKPRFYLIVHEVTQRAGHLLQATIAVSSPNMAIIRWVVSEKSAVYSRNGPRTEPCTPAWTL